MKITDPVLLSLFMIDNDKCDTSHAPKHRLERYSILNTKCIGVIDPEGPEKNITTRDEVGATTQHLTPAVVNIKFLVKCRSLESNQTKIKTEKTDPVLLSLFMEDNENPELK